jgi:hypothetical protein
MVAKSKGIELGEDLARVLQGAGYMVWTNQPLGSVSWDHVPIADVIAISKSYKPVIKIYEIKTSRGDFQADVYRGKYLNYINFCNYFYFATPAKLIDKNELPEGCGLTVHGDKNWRSLKAAPRHDCQLDSNLLMALLMKGYQNHFEEYRRLEIDYLKNYPDLVTAALHFGVKLSNDITDAKLSLPTAEKIKSDIEDIAGKKFNSLGWAVDWLRREVDTLLGKYKYGEEAGKLVDIALQLIRGYSWRAGKELQEIADKFKETQES